MVIEKESWSDGASAVHLVLSPEVTFFFISSVWTLVLLFRGLLITIYIKTTKFKYEDSQYILFCSCS